MRFQPGLLGSRFGPLFAPRIAHGAGRYAARTVGGGRGLRLALATLVLALGVLVSALATQAAAEVYVTNAGSGKVGEYTTSGATVNASLISGVGHPTGVALEGSDLYVANAENGTVGEYTTSGATVNAELIKGLHHPDRGGPRGLRPLRRQRRKRHGRGVHHERRHRQRGTHQRPAHPGRGGARRLGPLRTYPSGTVGEYTTSGATVNASLIVTLNPRPGWRSTARTSTSPTSVAARSGSTPRAAKPSTRNLISGLNIPVGVAVDSSDLYVAYPLGSTVGEYTTSGATVNASLISGLNEPFGVAVGPEGPPAAAIGSPSSGGLLHAGAGGRDVVLVYRGRRWAGDRIVQRLKRRFGPAPGRLTPPASARTPTR